MIDFLLATILALAAIGIGVALLVLIMTWWDLRKR